MSEVLVLAIVRTENDDDLTVERLGKKLQHMRLELGCLDLWGGDLRIHYVRTTQQPWNICILIWCFEWYLIVVSPMVDVQKNASEAWIVILQDTHKFEYGYNEQLIGKYPEEAHIYESRSPIRMADRLHCPIAFFHGDEDTVVPLSQSISLHNALKARGVPTMLLVFPGTFWRIYSLIDTAWKLLRCVVFRWRKSAVSVLQQRAWKNTCWMKENKI